MRASAGFVATKVIAEIGCARLAGQLGGRFAGGVNFVAVLPICYLARRMSIGERGTVRRGRPHTLPARGSFQPR